MVPLVSFIKSGWFLNRFPLFKTPIVACFTSHIAAVQRLECFEQSHVPGNHKSKETSRVFLVKQEVLSKAHLNFVVDHYVRYYNE